MTAAASRALIVVTGATGYQGSAVTRHLLKVGWRVRALTRNPPSHKAQALASLGAEMVKGDMADRTTLLPLFEDAHGVVMWSTGPQGPVFRPGKRRSELRRTWRTSACLSPFCALEVLVEKSFYPAMAAWHVMPILVRVHPGSPCRSGCSSGSPGRPGYHVAVAARVALRPQGRLVRHSSAPSGSAGPAHLVEEKDRS